LGCQLLSEEKKAIFLLYDNKLQAPDRPPKLPDKPHRRLIIDIKEYYSGITQKNQIQSEFLFGYVSG